jgi:hypothetical protein
LSVGSKDAEHIILGKRGRPSKKGIASTEKKIAETVLGNYFNKKEESIKFQKVIYNRNNME